MTQGDQALSLGLMYWNIQLGIETGVKGCRLTTAAAATDDFEMYRNNTGEQYRVERVRFAMTPL